MWANKPSHQNRVCARMRHREPIIKSVCVCVLLTWTPKWTETYKRKREKQAVIDQPSQAATMQMRRTAFYSMRQLSKKRKIQKVLNYPNTNNNCMQIKCRQSNRHFNAYVKRIPFDFSRIWNIVHLNFPLLAFSVFRRNWRDFEWDYAPECNLLPQLVFNMYYRNYQFWKFSVVEMRPPPLRSFFNHW